jgi:hypothetical protein
MKNVMFCLKYSLIFVIFLASIIVYMYSKYKGGKFSLPN